MGDFEILSQVNSTSNCSNENNTGSTKNLELIRMLQRNAF